MYLQEIRVKFIYEGYRIKVKVTGARKVDKHPGDITRSPSWHPIGRRRRRTSSILARETRMPAQIRLPAVWKFRCQ